MKGGRESKRVSERERERKRESKRVRERERKKKIIKKGKPEQVLAVLFQIIFHNKGLYRPGCAAVEVDGSLSNLLW